MSTKSEPMLYRILAQTETINIEAKTSRAVTELEAIEDAKKHVLHPKTVAAGGYRPFVVLPMGTEHQWKYGHINYCPRCGKYIGDEMGDPEDGIANNVQEFECSECYATVFVDISRTQEESGDE
ncbi:hypothetical protein ABH14_00300 [Brevibacillus brevis]|uniref:hypothetical protein n=1 Tax=Brevibacillus brevis TaxID=1393 RepID=UPI0019006FCE|nr:hypothetical protein [Brevibacillus brevis]MBH0328255.1 hypothetical protein [Brevibacillus brevis]